MSTTSPPRADTSVTTAVTPPTTETPLTHGPTTATTTTSVVAIMAQPAATAPTPTDTPAPRKFPAPCWTQEETLALISAYQDKWYSLRRRNLRTADWEAVAEEVTRRCPNQSPAKTSAQCRHKMEKLRKRYRTEKQRIVSLPNHGNHNRFFGSSWVFFDLMDSMELGSAAPGSTHTNLAPNNLAAPTGTALNNNNTQKVDLEVKPYSINHEINNNNNNNNNNNSKKGGGGDLGKYFDEILLSMGGRNDKGKNPNHEFDVRSAPPHHNNSNIKFKVKNTHGHDRGAYATHGYVDVNDDDDHFDGGEEYVGVGGRSGGFKRKSSSGNYERYEEMVTPKMVPLNGLRKEAGGGLGSRGRDAVVGEMVASIRMLGEGLVKMEKMKMEMMREIEQMRMQMEIKRSEMILESQHLIVNAFVEGMKKHKKVKLMQVE